MAVHIISNPVSGDGTGSVFVNEHVFPLVQHIGKYELFETTGPGAAEEYARQVVQHHDTYNKDPIVFIVGGGDGTVHEIVNGIGEISASRPIRLVLCPLGTANALYSTLFPLDPAMPEAEYRLKGIRAYLNGHFAPLTISKTSFYTAANQEIKSVYGVVVTSLALHAAILHSAERLRKTVKGIERFKIAAQENISHWCNGSVTLSSNDNSSHSESDSHSTIYDPSTDRFTAMSENTLAGPFAYFISTTNVDRLEPAFQISPLFTKSPPAPGQLDLIIVRPLRDPALEVDDEPSRTGFAPKLINVLQNAYQQGAHISMRHSESTHTPCSSPNNPFVVECIRTSGWRWIPERNDSRARLVCVDGALFEVPPQGSAVCRTINLNYSISR